MQALIVYLLTALAIESMIVLGYSLAIGYTGLMNFGHVGLVAIGAYTAGILVTRDVAFPIAVLAAVVLTAAIGALLALPARSVKKEHYALLTLGFTFVVQAVILNWTPVTRGPLGLVGITRPGWFESAESFFLLSLATVALVGLAVHRIGRSPFAKALEAVRDDEVAAASLGKPIGRLKVMAVVLSAAFAGLGGAYLAIFLQFINAQVFWLDRAVWYLSALVLGGLASFRGSVFGLLALYVLFEPLRFIPGIDPTIVGPLRLVLFSVFTLGILLFKPKGFFGRAQLED